MKAYLTLNGLLRVESDQTIADNLLRKGWVDVSPRPDPTAIFENGGWVIPPKPDYKQWANVQYFMDEFTVEERAHIALSTDPMIASLRLTLTTWLSNVLSNDPRVSLGLSKLVEAGILTPERVQQILSILPDNPLPPTLDAPPSNTPQQP